MDQRRKANRVIFIAFAYCAWYRLIMEQKIGKIIIWDYYIKKTCHETNDPVFPGSIGLWNAHEWFAATDQNW